MKVLKVLGLMMVLGFGSHAAFAADGSDGKIAVGAQGGLVFSDYSVDNAPFGRNYDGDNGYLAGLYAEFGLWTITLRPEINYVVKGYTVANTVEVKNKYLEVPVLLKINPFADMIVSPFIVVGPSFSKHLSTDAKFLGATASFDTSSNDWDVAGVGGLGVEFNIAQNLNISAQGRYNFGFKDIDRSSANIKSRGIYALGGIGLQF